MYYAVLLNKNTEAEKVGKCHLIRSNDFLSLGIPVAYVNPFKFSADTKVAGLLS